MKTCCKCKIDKENEEFYTFKVKKTQKIVLQSFCKLCNSIYAKENRRRINENKLLRRNTVPGVKEKEWANAKIRRILNPERALWTSAKDRAIKYNLNFDIEVIDIIIPEICPLLQIPLIKGSDKVTDYSPTLDKIIPELGYIKGNINVISRKANWMKSNAKKEDFEVFYKNIFQYLQKNG